MCVELTVALQPDEDNATVTLERELGPRLRVCII
jgi:hypothetical protein